MTNLTEQWKKGELPSGWYYVKLIRGEYRTDLYIKDKNEWIDCPDKIISEVLAEVPSYEEWQDQVNATRFYADEFFASCDENAKLKELLKEVRGKLKYINTPRNKHNIFGNDLMNKISEVLGEE